MCFRNLPVIIQSINKKISVGANIGKKERNKEIKKLRRTQRKLFRGTHKKVQKSKLIFVDDVISLT